MWRRPNIEVLKILEPQPAHNCDLNAWVGVCQADCNLYSADAHPSCVSGPKSLFLRLYFFFLLNYSGYRLQILNRLYMYLAQSHTGLVHAGRVNLLLGACPRRPWRGPSSQAAAFGSSRTNQVVLWFFMFLWCYGFFYIIIFLQICDFYEFLFFLYFGLLDFLFFAGFDFSWSWI